MAQTKTQKATASKAKAKGVRKTRATKVARSKKPQSNTRRAQSNTKRAKSKTQSQNGSSARRSADKGVVRDTAGNVGEGAGKAVSKAKIPLLAGGAAIAGTIGGVVLGATRSGGKVLGVQLPRSRRVNFSSKDLAKAAREVGRFGENVGDLAAEIKRTREGLGNGDGKHRSPIEVLLRGLTERR
jgi:hypothetical protein